MSDENRWSINELMARYELEPQLADVFVEGTFDRDVLSSNSLVRAANLAIYEIDSVDVPSEIVQKHGLTSGNKQRVITLARELAGLPDDVKFLCLVDKDLDHWFGSLEETRRLRWTTYCSIEFHFLSSEIIGDILKTTGRAQIQNLELFIESLERVLRQLYILRMTDKKCSLSIKWIALRKYLQRTGDEISFDIDKYTTAVLNTSGASSKRKKFDTEFLTFTQLVQGDIRQSSRGHDFTELLAWSMQVFNGQKEFASVSAIERLLVLIARSVPTLATDVL